MMQLLNLLGRVGVSLSAMRAELSLSVEPADLERLDVQPAFRAIVAKPHFVYVGFTHKERLAA
jgi:hypothetical protein